MSFNRSHLIPTVGRIVAGLPASPSGSGQRTWSFVSRRLLLVRRGERVTGKPVCFIFTRIVTSSFRNIAILAHSSAQKGSPPDNFAFEGNARLSWTPFSTSCFNCCCLRSASSYCRAAFRSASLIPKSKFPAPPRPVFGGGAAAGAAVGLVLSEGAGVPSPRI